MYRSVTRDIAIDVEPSYLEDQSDPDESRYVWAYWVRIENNGSETVRLQDRYWMITDGMGRQTEVRGSGVVGQHPVLKPGEIFEYTSGSPLSTPSGMMVGSYRMETESGASFDVRIPAFSLDSPYEESRLN